MAALTYNHFSLPRWIAAQGGWENYETVEYFVRYCEKVTEALGDLIGLGCTINEPNIAVMFACFRGQDLSIDRAAGAPFLEEAARQCGSHTFRPFLMGHPLWSRDNILEAHRQSVDVIRSGPGDFPVGWCLALQDYQAVDGGEERCAEVRRESQEIYLEASKADDFIGVQTYSRTRFDENGMLGPEAGVPVTQMNYEFWPEALAATIRFAADITEVPVYVTENGVASEDDVAREEYIHRALASMHEVIAEGIDVRGYYYWSAFDNFEWMLGYRPKFGLIEIERETQRRTVKPSALLLGKIARANNLF
ncbi:MAG: family 1 glycosylhydrolase [Pseudomonadota bacterium]